MAKVLPEAAEVNARILYWGIDGAGKRTVLQKVATKLRPDHRGDLVEVPTRFDPSESYTVLPIELGEIGGTRTRIELVAVPGSAEHAPTRKQLLDQVDGIVLVVDSQESRIEENAALLEELQKTLADYARRLEELPLVVQYNKRDLSNAYVIDELHRRLGLGAATVFETVATEGTGLLQALSTISKKVIRTLRETSIGSHGGVEPLAPRPEPVPEPEPTPQPIAVPEPTAEPVAESAPETVVQFDPEPEVELDDLPAPPPTFESEEPDPVLELDVDPVAQMESAILAEGDDAELADSQARDAQSLLEQPWHHARDDVAQDGARISAELSIVSVGEATRVDDRSLRVPLVLGDGEGETSTLVLTIRLDPLVDGASD
jgi:signal recognition particle receptor subunit beta